MNTTEYPRLLVLSNNGFSKSNSNGRTLGSLLQGWPKERLAQFCISSDGPDREVCTNYYCVTDGDVMRSTLTLRAARRRDLSDTVVINANATPEGYVRHHKTSLKMLARNAAWMLGLWRGKEFYSWVDNFAPEVILLQSGDSFFMHHLAMLLTRRTGARQATFNTEGYYFYKKDFFRCDGAIGHVLFKLYRTIYHNIFKKYIAKTYVNIYANDLLRSDYDAEFGPRNSHVIFTSSSIPFEPKEISTPPIFSYFGNMGFDRPKALIEFAQVLNELNPDYKLDVYGFVKDEAMKEELEACTSIRFHGAVPYSEVVERMAESDFLVHAESQDEKWQEALRHGFSTKIADSIASGKIFILYSSPLIACAQYIQGNGAGIFASNIEELKIKIKNVIDSQSAKAEIENKAQMAAKCNHNISTNINTMIQCLKH